VATVQQAFELALQHHQAGRLPEAETLYRQILAVQPAHADALHYLGGIAHQTGRNDAAVDLIGRSLALQPVNPAASLNLGLIFCAMGRRPEGIAAIRRALQFQPADADTHQKLADALRSNRELDAAAEAAGRALEIRPDFAEAHLSLGNVLMDQGWYAEAAAQYRGALQSKPGSAEASNNLGLALAALGRFDEAISAHRQALELAPEVADLHFNLGNALMVCGQSAGAAAAFRRALEIQPCFPHALSNLASSLWALGELEEGLAVCRRAIELQPNFPLGHDNLGSALMSCGRVDEAIEEFRRAIALNASLAGPHKNLGMAFLDRGLVSEAVAEFRLAVDLQPADSELHSRLILALHHLPDETATALATAKDHWARQISHSLPKSSANHLHEPAPERRLRIGYISSNFWDHVAGRNIAPLFRHHDHQHFEIVCYSGWERDDEWSRHFHRCTDVWKSTVNTGDEALAAMIRDDRIDILVDLAQHTMGNRLPVFARRPAPVQVSFAGYPESTGLPQIRYRISDKWMEGDFRMPIGDCRFGEASSRPETSEMAAALSYLDKAHERVFLVDSFWCYEPCGVETEVNTLPAQGGGEVTLGCLNTISKINDRVLALWARVMHSLPRARLAILCGQGSTRSRLLGFLERHGVDARRVQFLEPRPRREYLQLFQRLDIALDTFPYNGHTTNLEALWMGVPVVSLAGQTAVSRAGWSQLSNLGLPELIAHSPEEYIAIATRLAHDIPRLAELRRTLRSRMEASVLMEGPHFARQIEAAYRRMWQAWCAQPRV
jgi:predicted O-linked N-acetylglucosamine transferase (SPINDLY family)